MKMQSWLAIFLENYRYISFIIFYNLIYLIFSNTGMFNTPERHQKFFTTDIRNWFICSQMLDAQLTKRWFIGNKSKYISINTIIFSKFHFCIMGWSFYKFFQQIFFKLLYFYRFSNLFIYFVSQTKKYRFSNTTDFSQ